VPVSEDGAAALIKILTQNGQKNPAESISGLFSRS
jgi:hypothetical protein